MILNNKNGGPKRKNQPINNNANMQSFHGTAPIANSTVMSNTSAAFFNEPDQTQYNDPYQYYQPPVNTNGFYENKMPQMNQNQNAYNPNQMQPPVGQPQIYNTNNQPQYSPPGPQMFFNPQANIFSDPVASMAVQYGSTLAGQGKEFVAQNVDKWFSVSKLKYYFAVDTNYVAKKLLIILFPFINRDWSVKYNQTDANVSVPPKLDVNAPDMYIPVMAFVTYLLVVGIALGTQSKFSPEQLGIQASSALGWFIIETFIIFVTLQVLSIKSALKTFDIMAFCGYKYFGMIICLMASLLISTYAYHLTLIYMCLSFTYFMARTLKLMILTSNQSDPNPGVNNPYENSVHGNKRRVYVLLFISLIQPVFMWWLTRHLVA